MISLPHPHPDHCFLSLNDLIPPPSTLTEPASTNIMRKFDKYNCFYFANSCNKQSTIIFHLIGLLFFSSFPSVISELRSYTCNNKTIYPDGNTFSSNFNRVMGDLVKNAPQTGFNTSSYGQSSNRIYGLLQCKGDISRQSCLICSQQANDSIQQLCGNDIGVQVWLDLCFLRYENYTFFSKLDTNGISVQNGKLIGTSTRTNFVTTTFDLLSKLSDEAYVPENKGFAKGSAAFSFNGTVYGLVQCWRDLSIKDCRSCLRSATRKLYGCCSMHIGARALLGSCTARYELHPFFNISGASNYTSTSPPASSAPKPSTGAPPNPQPNGTSHTKSNGFSKTTHVILGIIGGMFLALAICLFALRRKLKSAISLTREQNEEVHDPQSTLLKQKQILFTYEALMESTDNFHESNKLGGGGFGSVYKGKTRDMKEIAVKKLSEKSRQGNEEFMNEVEVLANVRHRNLVKLLGCCAEGPERLIVYDYMPNKSLHALLFDPDHHQKRKLLDWQTRYKIIMGIARGLRYLHEESDPLIIHRDIKPQNILLDETLNSKIADFGLARLFPENESHIQISKVAGTYGYMAPEYAMQGQLSMKCDVYSFGVLVLEIVSGRKIGDRDLPEEMPSLLEWAWVLYKQGRLFSMVDSTISETWWQEAVRCIHVALLCTQSDAGNRPTIATVILMISSSSGTSLPNPKKPVFLENSESNEGGSTARRIDESGTYSVSPAHTPSRLVPSINDATITESSRLVTGRTENW